MQIAEEIEENLPEIETLLARELVKDKPAKRSKGTKKSS